MLGRPACAAPDEATSDIVGVNDGNAAACDMAIIKAKSKKGRFTLTRQSDAKSEGGGALRSRSSLHRPICASVQHVERNDDGPLSYARRSACPIAAEPRLASVCAAGAMDPSPRVGQFASDLLHDPPPAFDAMMPRAASTHDVPFVATPLHAPVGAAPSAPPDADHAGAPQPATGSQLLPPIPSSAAAAAAPPVPAPNLKKPSRFKVVSEVGDLHSVDPSRAVRSGGGAAEAHALGAAPTSASTPALPAPAHTDAMATVTKKLNVRHVCTHAPHVRMSGLSPMPMASSALP